MVERADEVVQDVADADRLASAMNAPAAGRHWPAEAHPGFVIRLLQRSREHDARGLATVESQDLGKDRDNLASARVLDQVCGCREAGELLARLAALDDAGMITLAFTQLDAITQTHDQAGDVP